MKAIKLPNTKKQWCLWLSLGALVALVIVQRFDPYFWKTFAFARYWTMGLVFNAPSIHEPYSKTVLREMVGEPDTKIESNEGALWKYRLGRFPFPGSAGAMSVWFNEAGEQVKCNWDDSDYE